MALLALLQGHELIRDAIDNSTKHDGYIRTCDLRADYLTCITGKGYERFLNRVIQRETPEEKEQRDALTHQPLSSCSNPVIKKADQISRVQDIKKGVTYTGTTDRDQQDLNDVFADFGGEGSAVRGSLEDYVTRNYDQISQYDPNSFIVLDYQPFNAALGERARPYGVRFDCHNVYNFRYTRGSLDFLLVVVYVKYKDSNGYQHTAKDYIAYCGTFTLRYFELTEERPNVPVLGEEWNSRATRPYRAVTYASNLDEVPAIRIGDLPDIETGSVTCVSRLFHAALEQFKELCDLKSLSDIVRYKHAFPRRYERAPECPGTPGENGMIQACVDGTNQVTKQKCTTCAGTGFAVHKSEQDTVRIKLTGQETKEDLFALSDLVFTEKPDLDTIKYLREVVQEQEQKIYVTIYTSDQQVQTQGPDLAKTATEYVVSREDQNNTLLPIADYKGTIIKFLQRICFKIMNISGEAKFKYEFSRDLKLTTADEILEKIATKAATVSSTVLEQLYDDYFEKVYELDSTGLAWHYFKKDHIEFYLIPLTEFQFYATSGYITDRDRTRRVYAERIVADLKNTVPGILEMKYAQQEAEIDKIVDKIIAELPEPMGLNEIPGEKNEVVDTEAEVIE